MTNSTKNSSKDIDSVPMPTIAVAMALCTFFLFACLDSTAKYFVTNGYGVFMVVWARYATHLIFLVFAFKAWSNLDAWRCNQPVLQIIRGLLLPTMTFLNFQALQYLQLDQTVTIFLATPLVVTALAGPFLGEWAGLRRWIAIFIAFIGVIIVARPGTSMFTPPIFLSIGSMLSMAVFTLLTRKLANTETTQSLIFYPAVLGTLLLMPSAITQWQTPDSLFLIVLLCSIGMFGMVGHYLLIRASALAAAAKLTPFFYTELLWMVLFGYLIFDDVPDIWTIVGATIICSSGLYLLYREQQIKRLAANQ